MNTALLVENEMSQCRLEWHNSSPSQKRSRARLMGAYTKWYQASLLFNAWSYLAVEDDGCAPETL